jgi:hypothetical protein
LASVFILIRLLSGGDCFIVSTAFCSAGRHGSSVRLIFCLFLDLPLVFSHQVGHGFIFFRRSEGRARGHGFRFFHCHQVRSAAQLSVPAPNFWFYRHEIFLWSALARICAPASAFGWEPLVLSAKPSMLTNFGCC